MKYTKHLLDGQVTHITMESNDLVFIPNAPGNRDYDRMVQEVADGDSTLVEVDDTHVSTWADNRIAAYGSWREQLDMMYHDTWKDHVASVKAANPKE